MLPNYTAHTAEYAEFGSTGNRYGKICAATSARIVHPPHDIGWLKDFP
jgi:hypothetical protein